MRKTPAELTGSIDNKILDFVEATSPYFKAMNFTPNMLTTLSLITGLASMYYFYYDNAIPATILYFLSYLFDCYDGFYARKYGMVTDFGDYYDHVKDVSIALIFFFIVYLKIGYLNKTEIIVFIIVGVVLLLLGTVHIGCQEVYYGKPHESHSLNSTMKLCPSQDKEVATKVLRNIRQFSVGMFVIYILVLMNYVIYKKYNA